MFCLFFKYTNTENGVSVVAAAYRHWANQLGGDVFFGIFFFAATAPNSIQSVFLLCTSASRGCMHIYNTMYKYVYIRFYIIYADKTTTRIFFIKACVFVYKMCYEYTYIDTYVYCIYV